MNTNNLPNILKETLYGFSFEEAFESVYGISWDEAIPVLAEAVSKYSY